MYSLHPLKISSRVAQRASGHSTTSSGERSLLNQVLWCFLSHTWIKSIPAIYQQSRSCPWATDSFKINGSFKITRHTYMCGSCWTSHMSDLSSIVSYMNMSRYNFHIVNLVHEQTGLNEHIKTMAIKLQTKPLTSGEQ